MCVQVGARCGGGGTEPVREASDGGGEWPTPVIDAHEQADSEERERVKVRMIAEGNQMFEFRVCRIHGDWIAVDDIKQERTLWVARRHVVSVWEERV